MENGEGLHGEWAQEAAFLQFSVNKVPHDLGSLAGWREIGGLEIHKGPFKT